MTEVRAIPGGGFPGPADACIVVECYVPERNIHAALERVARELQAEGYALRDVSRCLRFDLDDWNFDDHPKDSSVRQIVERITADNEVDYGPFCFS